MISGFVFICWVANLLLIISWIIPYKNIKLKIWFSSISTILSLAFLFFDEIMKNEAGHYGQITGYALGYWLWVSSSLLYLLANLWTWFKERNVIVEKE